MVAEAAHKARDEVRARLAIDKGLNDAAELFRKIWRPKRRMLPCASTGHRFRTNRRIVYRATKMYGVEAEGILTKVADPELNALATLEMARALLDRESRANSTMTSRRMK